MSTGHIPVSLQRRVRVRASERCEYCRIAQVGQEATFHVDHVMPQAAGGVTSLEKPGARVRIVFAAERSTYDGHRFSNR
jgi:hypothetical protein